MQDRPQLGPEASQGPFMDRRSRPLSAGRDSRGPEPCYQAAPAPADAGPWLGRQQRQVKTIPAALPQLTFRTPLASTNIYFRGEFLNTGHETAVCFRLS